MAFSCTLAEACVGARIAYVSPQRSGSSMICLPMKLLPVPAFPMICAPPDIAVSIALAVPLEASSLTDGVQSNRWPLYCRMS